MKVQGTYAQKVFIRLIEKGVLSMNGNSPEIVDMVTGRLARYQSYKRISKQVKLELRGAI